MAQQDGQPAGQAQPAPAAEQPQALAPKEPRVVLVAAQAAPGAPEARRTSTSPPPLYRPTLWGSQGGQKPERDSLRSRSKEGRPGSRKHRRWTHSVEIVGSLRRAMEKCGECSDHLAMDADGIDVELLPERRQSAFYRLLESEGPGGALEAWEAAESKRRAPSRPRRTSRANTAEENQRAVRRAFGDMWPFVRRDSGVQELIRKLEGATHQAFGAEEGQLGSEARLALQWLLSWDGTAFETKAGAPPTNEMAVLGLDPSARKVVHHFAQALGLHSESQPLRGVSAASDRKVLTIRLPRSRCSLRGAWEAPLSVSQVLAAA